MRSIFSASLVCACVVAAALLPGCQRGAVIDVNVSNQPDAASTYVVTAKLNGTPAVGTGQSLSQPRDHFVVQLDDALFGNVELHLSAQNSGGCEIATGSGAVPLRGAGNYSLQIVLAPQQGCTLEGEIV